MTSARFALAALVACLGCATPELGDSRIVRGGIETLEKELGIAVSLGPQYRLHYDKLERAGFAASRPEDADVNRYLDILGNEAKKLSPLLLRCSRLKRIALVSKLRVGRYRMGATPDFQARTLVLDVELYKDDPSFERWVFHHEFFHMLDFALNELIRSDDEWSRLNPSGFAYGSGGDRVWHDPETACSTKDAPSGFVTQYATMGAEEDKAEIFALTMTSPNWSSHPDATVIRKARFLLDRIALACAE